MSVDIGDFDPYAEAVKQGRGGTPGGSGWGRGGGFSSFSGVGGGPFGNFGSMNPFGSTPVVRRPVTANMGMQNLPEAMPVGGMTTMAPEQLGLMAEDTTGASDPGGGTPAPSATPPASSGWGPANTHSPPPGSGIPRMAWAAMSQKMRNQAWNSYEWQHGQHGENGPGSTNPFGGSNAQPSFDPNNPYASFSGDTRTDWAGMLNRLLGQFGGSGAFGPGGSPAVMDAVMRNATRQSQAGQQRADLQGQVYGLDPAQQAFGHLQSGLQGQSDVANQMGNAQLQQLLSSQDFGRQLLGGFLGSNYGFQGQRLASQLQPQQGTDWGSVIGQLGGAVIGGMLGGPPGAAIGGGLGRSAGGSIGGQTRIPPRMQY